MSCNKDNGELSGDDIIQFKDSNFLKALLTVQEIEIYDEKSDEEVLYLVDVDTNMDGQISVNEAQKLKGLELWSYQTDESFKVSEMPEIKYFTALTCLDCYDNQLTYIDLSNNVNLIWLECEQNQLTSLDLSNNIALNSLSCSSNRLTSLDINKNVALDWLSCGANQLTSLDVSKNTALTYLRCYNNQLSSLDISNNTALIELNCEHNQITSLDVSKNTALTELYCYGNPLKTLTISANQQNANWLNFVKQQYPDIEIIVK